MANEIEVINPLDDTARIRWHREAEADQAALDKAREVPLHDMTLDELQVVILHDPDLIERRTALRLFRLSILLDAETRIMDTLARARK